MYENYNYEKEEVKEEKKDNNKITIIIGIIIGVLLIGVGLFLLFGLKKEKPNVTPLMYEVTKEGSDNKIYLFGSIHFANIEDMIFPSYLTDAYNDTDYLACEFDINKFLEEVDQTELAQGYLYMDGTTLRDHINVNLYNQIIDYVKENYGYTEDISSRFHLTYIEALITQQLLIKTGINSTKGIDTYFLNKAHEDNKNILEVESFELQDKMQKSFSDRYYELTIEDALNNQDKSVDDLKKLYEVWKRGNEKEIEEIAITSDYSKYSEDDIKLFNNVQYKMLDERNIGMANKLKEYFNDNKKVFYMVGAAHLVGDNGIANLLKQDGYTVKIVK